MGLTLDESTDNDDVFEIEDITFIIEKNLSSQLTTVVVDFQKSLLNGSGFFIKPQFEGIDQSASSGCC